MSAPPASPDLAISPDVYAQVLGEYARTRSEAALYRASLLSQACVRQGFGPEEIIALHGEAVDMVGEGYSDREKVRLGGDALQFLLEVMIAYGVQHTAYAELQAREAQRRVEEERRRADEAERSEQAKSELMAMVAHELRTPIAAAMGSLQLARRSLRKGEVERLPRLLDSAEETLLRLSRLTADLVQASRGEPPNLQLTPQELVVVVRQACTWAAAVAEERGVELVRDAETWSARVLGDPDALITVFGNLLANAIRYTPAGGRVTVRYGTDDARAWVEVSDTGIGMTPEVQAQIFEQFFRAPEAKQMEKQGLGLGLYLVQRLVHAHGGEVVVASAPGQGSTFRVALPLLTPEGSN